MKPFNFHVRSKFKLWKTATSELQLIPDCFLVLLYSKQFSIYINKDWKVLRALESQFSRMLFISLKFDFLYKTYRHVFVSNRTVVVLQFNL